MTVSSVTRKAGPFAGNNSATTFPFSFKVFDKTDVKVSVINPSGATTPLTLDSDYSVTLNANQNSTPGGWVTYPLTGAPLAYSYDLVVLGDLPNNQETDITNSGGFYPQVIEDMVDRATIQIQQLSEIASRAIAVSPSESVSPTLPPALSRINTLLGFDALGNMELYAITPAVGAGDLKNEAWTDGQDYTSGTSTTVTLSRKYGTKANLGTVVMAGVAQDPATYDLGGDGTQLVFNATIPAGVGRIWCIGGTTLSVYLPPAGSVADAQVASGSKLLNRILGLTEARDEGALGNGVQDDSVAFASVAPHMFVVDSGLGDYLVATNTTITANLTFMGGAAITVAAGVTLTVKGTIKAPHKVIFKGAGTVKISNGPIDCAWFDGADTSAKFAFLARGLDNSNTLTKTVEFYTPDSTDAWAVLSTQSQWGYAWACDNPIKVTQLCGGTRFMAYAPFVARSATATALWDMGNGASKADGWHFPLPLLLDGNGLGVNGMLVEGASTFSIHSIDAHGVISGLVLEPNGVKQVSNFRIGPVTVGESTGTGIVISGDSATNSVSDGVIEYGYSTGLTVAGADSFVAVSGNVQNVKFLQGATVRAVNTGRFDYALSAVTVSNKNNLSPTFGLDLGYVLSASATPTSRAVTITDSSGGTAPKIAGVTMRGGIASVSPAFSLDYCTAAKLYDADDGATVTIGVGAVNTKLYGVNASKVTDNGTGTVVNGHNYGAATAIAAPGSDVAWVNDNHFPVLFQVQGATTITNVVYTRGSTPVTVANSGTAGAWVVMPGDKIAVEYTGAPLFNIIPM